MVSFGDAFKSNNSDLITAQVIDAIANFFSERQINSYLMGGAVRDALLNRTPNDLDFVVESQQLFELAQPLARTLDGRLIILDKSRCIFRICASSDIDSWQVDISQCESGIVDHLKSRDCTIDSMAIPMDSITDSDPISKIVDPTEGIADLRKSQIRLNNPQSLEDDPVRIIRIVRLACQLQFQLESNTRQNIKDSSHLLKIAPRERVRDEFLSIIALPNATNSIRLLDELGLLSQLLPVLDSSRGIVQPKEHQWVVFDHLVETIGQVEVVLDSQKEQYSYVSKMIPRHQSINGYFEKIVSDGHTVATFMKLAGLLHDVAKPATKTIEESGKIRFLGHHSLGSEMVSKIMEDFRISKRGVAFVSTIVQNHLRPAQMSPKGEMPSAKAVYRFYRDVGEAAIPTLYVNLADYLAARGSMLEEAEWSRYCGLIGHILDEGLNEKAPISLPKILGGHDIMEAFGLSPGPEVGHLLDFVHEAYVDGEIINKVEALDLIRSHLLSRGSNA